MKPKITVILGPTASGKTRLALLIAHEQAGAVVSADSRQVYAGLNIGTAKPREAWEDTPHAPSVPDTVDSVPHYLMNIRSIAQGYTLAEWQQDAAEVLADLISRNIRPIVAGGTMLYIDSLTNNYTIPPVSPNAELRAQLERQSTEMLYAELVRQDPAAQEFVESHNRRRIIRALEVINATGVPFSAVRRVQPPKYDYEIIGLFPGWDQLERTVTQRAQEMIEAGLVDEKRRLTEHYGSNVPLLTTINYAQAGDLPAMVRANMRYAHRQMSWWKRNKNITWFATTEEALQSLAL